MVRTFLLYLILSSFLLPFFLQRKREDENTDQMEEKVMYPKIKILTKFG